MGSLPCAPRGSGKVKAEDCMQVAVELKAALSGTPHLTHQKDIFARKSLLCLQVRVHQYATTSRMHYFLFEDQKMTYQ